MVPGTTPPSLYSQQVAGLDSRSLYWVSDPDRTCGSVPRRSTGCPDSGSQRGTRDSIRRGTGEPPRPCRWSESSAATPGPRVPAPIVPAPVQVGSSPQARPWSLSSGSRGAISPPLGLHNGSHVACQCVPYFEGRPGLTGSKRPRCALRAKIGPAPGAGKAPIPSRPNKRFARGLDRG